MISTKSYVRVDDGYDIATLWSIAWRAKYIVIVMGLLVGGCAVVYALTAKEVFRAEVIVVQADSEGLSGSGGIAGQLGGLANLVGMNFGQSIDESLKSIATLKSWRLAQEFVTRYKVDTEMLPSAKKASSLWQTVKMFREGVLTITEDKRNRTVSIAVRFSDPVVAARWANDFVATANELRRNEVIAEAKRNIEYLNQQIEKTSVIELQRVSYNLIEGETKKLMLASARPDFAFLVIDPAVVPEQRISPNRTMIVLTGGILGGLLGLVMGLLLNAFAAYRAKQSSIRSE